MSIKRSIYEEIRIESNDQSRSIDISGGTVSIDYYEDLFSPVITAKIKVVNVGNTVKNESFGENQSIIRFISRLS